MMRLPSRITRQGYGVVRIPQTGRTGAPLRALRTAARFTAKPSSPATTDSSSGSTGRATTPMTTPETSTPRSLGRSAFSASSVRFSDSGDGDVPTILRKRLVAAATLSAPSVYVKSASSAAARNDSSSVRSSSTHGFAWYASAVAASRSRLVLRLPTTVETPLDSTSLRPYFPAMSERLSRFSPETLASLDSRVNLEYHPLPIFANCSYRSDSLILSLKIQQRTARAASTMNSTTRQPQHPPCRRPDASAGSAGFSVVSAASTASGFSAASGFSFGSSGSAFGHLSAPHGTPAGPTANDVAPEVITSNCSTGLPSTMTPPAVASTLSGASGIVESTSTMSQSSPLPSVTATPSTSATSAPLFGPSTIFSR